MMKRKQSYDHEDVPSRKKKILSDSVDRNRKYEVNGKEEKTPNGTSAMNEKSRETRNLSTHDQLVFDPIHFLRCHSRNNDCADVQTQVWYCAFEPDAYRHNRTTDIVATCGGNSVCFIDVKEGEAIGKYFSEDKTEMFYTLAWTTLRTDGSRVNILAVGGSKNTVHLIHPGNMVGILKTNFKTGGKVHISSLLFHPLHSNILFCSNSQGDVLVCDIGMPLPPDYIPKLTVLHTLVHETEIFSLTFSVDLGVLLAACNDGLVGWKIGSKVKATDKFEKMQFEMPPCRSKVVDSLEFLEEGLVATKSALSSNICLWNLKEALAKPDKTVKPVHLLQWAVSDNYFMLMGYNRIAGLLVCGDDKGYIWVYDIHALLREKAAGEGEVPPSVILPWPTLTDTYVDKKRKMSLGTYDIVVDRATVNHEGDVIVAVTNNNMVCIWKRVSA